MRDAWAIILLSCVGCGGAAKTDPPVTDPCAAKTERWAEATMGSHERFLTKLESVHWSDCDAAKADLLALEPDALAHVDAMAALFNEINADAACKDVYISWTRASPRADAVARRIGEAAEQGTAAATRCETTTGFNGALDVGLRPLATP